MHKPPVPRDGRLKEPPRYHPTSPAQAGALGRTEPPACGHGSIPASGLRWRVPAATTQRAPPLFVPPLTGPFGPGLRPALSPRAARVSPNGSPGLLAPVIRFGNAYHSTYYAPGVNTGRFAPADCPQVEQACGPGGQARRRHETTARLTGRRDDGAIRVDLPLRAGRGFYYLYRLFRAARHLPAGAGRRVDEVRGLFRALVYSAGAHCDRRFDA